MISLQLKVDLKEKFARIQLLLSTVKHVTIAAEVDLKEMQANLVLEVCNS